MKLLIDIGNSRLKWTLADANTLASVQSMDYRLPASWECLARDWQAMPEPALILIACVASSECFEKVESFAKQIWPICSVHRVEVLADFANVKVAYANPKALGVDRWLTLLATQHYYAGNNCIVDCGTAMTLDLLKANGEHQGGLIIPGLQLMRASLNRATADLPLVSDMQLDLVADNTESAIANGSIWAAVGLIETVMRKSLFQQLILTGGAAKYLLDALDRPAILDNGLVLRGMLHYAERLS
jgi:type III pantothenate kinase